MRESENEPGVINRVERSMLANRKMLALSCLVPICLSTVLCSCSATPDTAELNESHYDPTSLYAQGAAQGVQEADQQAADGNATIYWLGFASPSNRDRETGLPTEGVAGCAVTPLDLGRVQAHNQRIRALWRQGKIRVVATATTNPCG